LLLVVRRSTDAPLASKSNRQAMLELDQSSFFDCIESVRTTLDRKPGPRRTMSDLNAFALSAFPS
jgi:hypothetical protein